MKTLPITYNLTGLESKSTSQAPYIFQKTYGNLHILTYFNSEFDGTNSIRFEKLNDKYSSYEARKNKNKVKDIEQFISILIKKANIKEAKESLDTFQKYSSPLMEKWRKALNRKPPKSSGTASLKQNEIKNDSEWIKNNRSKYESKWVALLSGEILDYNDDLAKLKERLKEINNADNVTFIKL